MSLARIDLWKIVLFKVNLFELFYCCPIDFILNQMMKILFNKNFILWNHIWLLQISVVLKYLIFTQVLTYEMHFSLPQNHCEVSRWLEYSAALFKKMKIFWAKLFCMKHIVSRYFFRLIYLSQNIHKCSEFTIEVKHELFCWKFIY